MKLGGGGKKMKENHIKEQSGKCNMMMKLAVNVLKLEIN